MEAPVKGWEILLKLMTQRAKIEIISHVFLNVIVGPNNTIVKDCYLFHTKYHPAYPHNVERFDYLSRYAL